MLLYEPIYIYIYFAQICENKFPQNFSKHASERDYNEHDGNVFDLF